MSHCFIVLLNSLVHHLLKKEKTVAKLSTTEGNSLEGNIKKKFFFVFVIFLRKQMIEWITYFYYIICSYVSTYLWKFLIFRSKITFPFFPYISKQISNSNRSKFSLIPLYLFYLLTLDKCYMYYNEFKVEPYIVYLSFLRRSDLKRFVPLFLCSHIKSKLQSFESTLLEL